MVSVNEDDNDSEDREHHRRRRPNILITGTPGVGKTATASLLAERLRLKHISPGDLAKERHLYDGRDETLDTYILDEDKLLDAMEALIEESEEKGIGVVADFHMCEIFPERWFDLVLVLRANTEVLYDRLTSRGYSEKKLSENMESEIMQVILDEAREAYDPAIVHEVPSNTLEEMESNVERVQLWSKQWIADHAAHQGK
jgi:adenylate kinase